MKQFFYIIQRSSACIMLILLMGLGVQAQPTESMSVDACIAYALTHNQNIKIRRLDEYIAAEQVKEVVANGYPQISGSADLQYFVELPTSIFPGEFSPQQEVVFIDGKPYPLTSLDPETLLPIPGQAAEVQFGTPWQSTAGFSANQLIFDGAFFLGLRASKSFQDITRKATQQSEEEIALAVTKAYYQTLIVQEQLNQLEANITRVFKLYQETSILNKEGFAEKIDVSRLKITYTNLQVERDKVARLAENSLYALKFQMGMPLKEDIELSEYITSLTVSPFETPDELAFTPQLRIEYQLLEAQRNFQEYALKGINVGYYPSLYGFGSYQFNAQRNAFDFFDSDQRWFPISVVGLQLNVPIFDGFRKKAQAAQAKLEIQKIETQKDILQASFDLEIQSSYRNLLNAYVSLNSLKENKELAEEVLRVAKIKYVEGVGSSLEVNEAESQLKQAESSYLSGLLEYLMFKADYQKAMGGFAQYRTNE
ncbi:MAG: TolC family protein [Bacteroidota bacterium]